MSNVVRRWVITDPYDTNPATRTYLFPRNPRDMTNLNPERNVVSVSTTNHRVLLYEGQTPTRQWSFSGPLFDKQQFNDLHAWVYDRKNRLVINDHYGRNITLVFTSFEITPKRRSGYYYSHEYVVNAIVLDVSAPTVDNAGPVQP